MREFWFFSSPASPPFLGESGRGGCRCGWRLGGTGERDKEVVGGSRQLCLVGGPYSGLCVQRFFSLLGLGFLSLDWLSALQFIGHAYWWISSFFFPENNIF